MYYFCCRTLYEDVVSVWMPKNHCRRDQWHVRYFSVRLLLNRIHVFPSNVLHTFDYNKTSLKHRQLTNYIGWRRVNINWLGNSISNWLNSSTISFISDIISYQRLGISLKFYIFQISKLSIWNLVVFYNCDNFLAVTCSLLKCSIPQCQ